MPPVTAQGSISNTGAFQKVQTVPVWAAAQELPEQKLTNPVRRAAGSAIASSFVFNLEVAT